MNGIVHPCSHPEEGEPPETEEAMMLAVFAYTERVVNMVRPRKLLMIAVGMFSLIAYMGAVSFATLLLSVAPVRPFYRGY